MDAITLLTNAAAGSSDESSVAQAAKTLGRAARVTELATSTEDELGRAMSTVTGPLVVAGGDGSLHAAVAALHRRGRLGEVVLGLVPLGTGNDFARGVGIPLGDPAAAAQVFLDGVRRDVDLITDEEGGVVVNAVHTGVGAEAARAAKPWKARLGRLGYVVGAVRAGVTTQGYLIKVVADTRVVADGTRRVLQVAVANGSFVGGGTPLSPAAEPVDGLADVTVSFAVPPLSRLQYALRLRRGTHDGQEDVITLRAGSVAVEGGELWLNADGELVGPVSRRTWTVQPAALSMILPTPTPTPRT